MRPRVPTFRPGRERGWVGLVVILVALAIVAWLSKDALLKYGMLSGGTTAAKRSGGSAAPAAEAAAAPTPSSVMEKAKSLEGVLQQESARRDGGN